MTRADWAKRPLAERELAAEEWCNGWNDCARNASRAVTGISQQHVIDTYALDLPDTPADDLTPWIAVVIDKFHPGGIADFDIEHWASVVAKAARALRDATREVAK